MRGRIRRGKLEAEHDDAGTVYVWIDTPVEADSRGPSGASQRPSADLAERIEDLREEVAYLREQLQHATERDRENRRIIVALTSGIPAIEALASPEERESGVSPGPTATPTEAATETQEGTQRRWWRRLIGG